jgi:ketosteroid isomerase-like protein
LPTNPVFGRLEEGSMKGPAMGANEFDELVGQARRALDAIAKGDPSGYQALYSNDDDITLGNPFGGFGSGRAAVYEQLQRAASYYREGRTTGFETVTQAVGPDIAYTVEIERFETKVDGREELSELALRVTCIYRREADGWKLVHRHADPRVERHLPESVIHH